MNWSPREWLLVILAASAAIALIVMIELIPTLLAGAGCS